MKTKRKNKKYAKHLTKHRMQKRKEILIILCVMVAAALIGHQSLKQPYSVEIQPKIALTHRLPESVDKKVLSVPDQIRVIAQKQGFQWPDYLVKLAYCESRFDPLAIGDSGKSRGLFQIHKGFHPEVSNEQAFNIRYATEWTIKMINSGKQKQWSCNSIILARK